jgi:hypothetical protein
MWFNSKLLSLNLNKTYCVQFIIKNKFSSNINIEYNNKMKIKTDFIKFFGIAVENTLTWKQHIEAIIPKLNTVCYIIRSCKLYL